MNKILEVTNLNYRYDKSKGDILKNINFSINSGEIIALIGSNGSGKSTLMNNITGFLKPTSGTVQYFEEGFSKYDVKQPFASIGYSPQIQMMDWYSDVFDNVILGSLLFGNSIKESKRLSSEALKKVNLDAQQLIKKLPETLSGGQQQRVQLARAIVHNPEFLILDEPTVGLDVESAEMFLQSIQEAKVTALISSHDINILEKYADKLLFIDKGEVLYFGDLQTFITKYSTKGYKSIVFTSDHTPKITDELTAQIINFKLDNNKVVVLAEDVTETVKILIKYGTVDEILELKKSLRDIYYEMKVSK